MLFILVILGLGACQSSNEPGPIPNETEIGDLQVAGSETFSLNLLREVNQQEQDAKRNIFLAPLSVKIALGMLLNGADGSTAQEIQNTLGLSGISLEQINQDYKSLIEALGNLDPEVTVNIANSIWHDQSFSANPSFIDTLQDVFSAEVEALDFKNPASKDVINNWVKDKTENTIDKILDSIDPNELMFLINAIYFKGGWSIPFDPDNTSDQDFFISPNETKKVPMMLDQISSPYTFQDNYVAFQLHYGQAKYVMTVLLPNEDYSVDQLIQDLDEEEWLALHENMFDDEIFISLPKFETEYELTLNQILGKMGMPEVFTNRANLSKIASNLKVSKVKHKTFLKVDEEGTEAAGVTSVGVVPLSLPPSITCNRPFVIMIEEKETNTILFAGKIVNP